MKLNTYTKYGGGVANLKVLDSDGNEFIVSKVVLDSDGNEFTVTSKVLDSDGNEFTVK